MEPTTESRVDWTALAKDQKTCQETVDLAENPDLHVRRVTVSGVEILCGFSSGAPRPLVPLERRKED